MCLVDVYVLFTSLIGNSAMNEYFGWISGNSHADIEVSKPAGVKE